MSVDDLVPNREVAVDEVSQSQAKLLGLMNSDITRRLALYKTLKFCLSAKSEKEVETELASLPECANSIYAPSTLRSWLEDAGGLQWHSEAGGELFCKTTVDGEWIVRKYDLTQAADGLLSAHPKDIDVYLKILSFCVTSKSRAEIIGHVGEHPSQEDPNCYATLLLSRLESVGALEWIEKWQTTELGKQLVTCED